MIEKMTESEISSLKTDIAVIKRDITQISQVYKKVDDTLDQMTQLAKTIAVQEKTLENDTRRIVLLEENMVKRNQDDVEFRKDLSNKLEDMTYRNAEDRDKHHRELLEALKEMSISINNKIDKQDERISVLEKWRWYIVGGLAVILFAIEKFGPILFGG